MKTKALAIIAVILLTVLALILYFSSTRTRLPIPTVEEPTVEEEAVKGTIYLSAKLADDGTGKSVIQITATPDNEGPFLLSALSIKGVVISDGDNLSTIEEVFVLTPDKELTDNKWVFIDKAAYSDTKGGVVVELNGYHHSEEMYPLMGEVVLATIPLSTTPSQQMFTFELDSKFTEFFGEDTKEEFMIKAK